LIVDMHAHVFTAEALAGLEHRHKKYAPQLLVESGKHVIATGGNAGGPMPYMRGFSDVEERLAVMDESGVDVQIVSVTPGNFCYDAPPESGLAIAIAQNDAIAEMVTSYPGRFVGCATVPLQDPEAAARELNRCRRDLGFKGVEIGTNVAGKNLDSPELAPFFAEAARLGMPILVHPINNAGANRMGQYYLGNIVGNPAETTIAIGSVVFGGLLDRYKGITFCWSHGGGFWPYQIGRFDHGYSVRAEPKVNAAKTPSGYARRMYYDTITHSEEALKYLISSMGAENVLYGTDHPWDMGDYDTIPTIKGLSSLKASEKEAVLGATSARLFGVKP
jgi:aminocarboxymuconate-semialdehyde decarboxylase